MTRLRSLILGLVILVMALPAMAATQVPRVVVNGTELVFDVPPVIENGRTLVPMRAIFEALGAAIYWDAETRTVSAGRGEVALAIQIGNPLANINNEGYIMDVPAKIIDGRTMVPLRFVSQALGADVQWDPATYTATITDAAAPSAPPAADPVGPPAPTAPARLEPFVGAWSNSLASFRAVDPQTGLPDQVNWNGDWYYFRADGTFRHASNSCGPLVCGLTVLDGNYDVEDNQIRLYNVLETWIPHPQDPSGHPAHEGEPKDEMRLPYEFESDNELVLNKKTLHRLVQDEAPTIVGTWSNNDNSGLFVYEETGRPAEALWGGEWYYFRKDGTFRYVTRDRTPYVWGELTYDGRYTVEGGTIKLYEIEAFWNPDANDPSGQRWYSGKPVADRQLAYALSDEGTLLLTDELGWTRTFHRPRGDQPLNPESIKPVVGGWTKHPSSFRYFDDWGNWTADYGNVDAWFFDEDGTYTHIVGGTGPIISGLTVEDGYYTVQHETLFLYNTVADWIPAHNDPSKRFKYKDKPVDDRTYPFRITEDGKLWLLEDGFDSHFHRIVEGE